MRRGLIVSVFLVGAVAALWAMPWSQDMVHSRAILPQTEVAVPPANTLAVGHPRILDRVDAEELLMNPLEATPAVVEQGRTLFETYCVICHGRDGRGGGRLGKYFMKVPDLSIAEIQAYPDGLLYSVIREGGFNMPGYAESLSAQERWAVVHFIRSLR
ncbi:MAG TPA: c-type cytochrome [Vicinamibacterales bacterium]|jgi:mono/diheme cytochrome c family protein